MLRLNLGRMNFDIIASDVGGAQVLYCAQICWDMAGCCLTCVGASG